MEYFDVADENGIPTGEIVSRSVAHREGIRHRTAHVWILRKQAGKTQLLLQKRSCNKDSFPGMYDTSSAGHIPAGVDPVSSAIRELEEELGIHASPDQLEYIGNFSIQYEKQFHGSLFRDNEVVFEYIYHGPVDTSALKLQPEEVEEVRWFDLDDVDAEVHSQRKTICVPTEGIELLIAHFKE